VLSARNETAFVDVAKKVDTTHVTVLILCQMAKKLALLQLSRRERQILDVLYKAGRATAAEVQASLPAAPSYSAVRTLLRILEEKGHVRHEQDGARYVYIPSVRRDQAKRSALRHLLETFFDGSATQAIATLLDQDAKRLSPDDWERLEAAIERARKEGARS
jgi:predicted transcriptional regulator